MLEYDALTEEFKWKREMFNKSGNPKKGNPVIGHNIISIDGDSLAVKRVIWLYVYGIHPPGYVKSKNGDNNDFKLSNLQLVLKNTVSSKETKTRPKARSGNKLRNRPTRLPKQILPPETMEQLAKDFSDLEKRQETLERLQQQISDKKLQFELNDLKDRKDKFEADCSKRHEKKDGANLEETYKELGGTKNYRVIAINPRNA